MSMRSTHTFALVPVSEGLFDEVKVQLEEAGYQHAIIENGDEMVLDMHGLALTIRKREPLGPQVILVAVGDNQTAVVVGWRDFNNEGAERSYGLLHCELDTAGHDIYELPLGDDAAFPRHRPGLYLWSGKVYDHKTPETTWALTEHKTVYEGKWLDATTSHLKLFAGKAIVPLE